MIPKRSLIRHWPLCLVLLLRLLACAEGERQSSPEPSSSGAGDSCEDVPRGRQPPAGLDDTGENAKCKPARDVIHNEEFCNKDAADGAPMWVARAQPDWKSLFSFVSAVRVRDATAVHVPDGLDPRGPPRHFLVGDGGGTLHVFSINGRLLHSHTTSGASPITAVYETKDRKNSSVVVTGHANGCVLWHAMDESYSTRAPALHAVLSLALNFNRSYCPGENGETAQPRPSAAIRHVFVGRVSEKAARMLLCVAATEADEVLLLRDFRQPPRSFQSQHKVLHVSHEKRQVQVMTEAGCSTIFPHLANATLRSLRCHELNETRLAAALPDTYFAHRAYAYASTGQFVGLALTGPKKVIGCRARFKSELDVKPVPTATAVAGDAIIFAQPGRLRVFNSSAHMSTMAQPVLEVAVCSLQRAVGLHVPCWPPGAEPVPLLHSNADFHVVLQIAPGLLAVYSRPSASVAAGGVSMDWLRWARPLMVFGMVVYGALHFSRSKGAPARSFPNPMNPGADRRMDAIQRLSEQLDAYEASGRRGRSGARYEDG